MWLSYIDSIIMNNMDSFGSISTVEQRPHRVIKRQRERIISQETKVLKKLLDIVESTRTLDLLL
jgi:hypothetical protein